MVSKITDSLKTPDLHGTLLCLWAINMILDNIERLEDDKQIIKPKFLKIISIFVFLFFSFVFLFSRSFVGISFLDLE